MSDSADDQGLNLDQPHEDSHGNCTTCGRFVGDGEYECQVPGGVTCTAGELDAKRLLEGAD